MMLYSIVAFPTKFSNTSANCRTSKFKYNIVNSCPFFTLNFLIISRVRLISSSVELFVLVLTKSLLLLDLMVLGNY